MPITTSPIATTSVIHAKPPECSREGSLGALVHRRPSGDFQSAASCRATSEPTATRPPKGATVTATAIPSTNEGTSTRVHDAPSGDGHATAPEGCGAGPPTPPTTNPSPNLG